MKNALSPMKSSAKVVDGKLILSFPNAEKPVVWQMDFAHVKASALEVQAQGDSFALILKTPKGENVEIAPFANKNDAVKGLMAASKALESAEGQIRPGSESAGVTAIASKPKKSAKWLPPVLALVMLFILINVWAMLSAPREVTTLDTVSNTQSNSVDETGVPLSADEFLRAQ
ncbi:MAG: hypothetical protein KDJ35_08410 [Alphaproteobacteria bacterium]|nr:hypothetical protein [Alphaproteobacteria bacterium]